VSEGGERRAEGIGKRRIVIVCVFLSLSLPQGIVRAPRAYGYVQNTLEETVERHRARTGKDAARGTEDAVWEEGEGERKGVGRKKEKKKEGGKVDGKE
jgi:hypothetical protein